MRDANLDALLLFCVVSGLGLSSWERIQSDRLTAELERATRTIATLEFTGFRRCRMFDPPTIRDETGPPG